MKKIGLIIHILLLGLFARAQDADVKTLINQGTDLYNKSDREGALEKYKQALAIAPDDAEVNYMVGMTFFALKKRTESITYLNKAVAGTSNYTAAAYELLGVIYDDDHQPQKAIEAYKAGLKIQPERPDLNYGLALVYFRTKQYAEAEQAAITTIKINPTGAGGQRLYALVCFHQNKRAPALLALCTFLMLEPDGSRSAEAYTNMQSILKGGTLKIESKADAENIALNKALSAAAATTDTRRYASPADLLAAQLKAVFMAVGQLAEKQTGNDFFRNYYASFFYKLAQTEHMPAFARLMDLSANKAADSQWLQQNDDKRKALEAWVSGQEKSFKLK